MSLKKPDLNLYLVFDTIYSERNLTRAAEKLSLTQPSVSNALARLRGALDDPLFIKSGGSMQPTGFADSIAERVNEALNILQSVSHKAETFDPASCHRIFRLSLMDLHDAELLPELVTEVNAIAPHVEIQVVRVPRAELPMALAQGTVDLATDIPLPDTTNLTSSIISRANYVCAMRPGHPLEGKDLTLKDYLSLTHVHVSARRKGAAAIDIALRKRGKRRQIGVSMQNYYSVSKIVHNTDMVATITDRLADRLDLSAMPLPISVAPLEIRLYRHVRSKGDVAIDWLVERILEKSAQ